MEDFLDTLPTFVHDYLSRYPINTLSLLKELVCFAVLYSNDRDIICLLTEQLLREEKNIGVPEITNALENVFLKQEERLSTREEEENNESNMKQTRDIKEEGDHMIVSEEPPSNLVSLWIPWKEDHSIGSKSQITIPMMSSYHEISYDNLEIHDTFDKFWKTKKSPRPILINSNYSSTNASQISSPATLSESPTPLSPISPLSLKPISFKKPISPPLVLRKSMSETTGRGQFTLQRPGNTFTVQARIDHAQRRQKELERKKLLAMMPLESSISKRLKQRVNSGIDWKAIKNQGKLSLHSKKDQ